jgi:hypothetical protein
MSTMTSASDGAFVIIGVGISLTPGPVPDHESGEKGATRPGWLALGTLVRQPAAEQQGQARSPAA